MPEPKYRFTFGKYKNRFIDEVPNHYLVWAHDNIRDREIHSAVALELSRRFALPDPEERKRVAEAIKKFCEGL